MNPSALLECLHLEALSVRVSLRDSLVTLLFDTEFSCGHEHGPTSYVSKEIYVVLHI